MAQETRQIVVRPTRSAETPASIDYTQPEPMTAKAMADADADADAVIMSVSSDRSVAQLAVLLPSVAAAAVALTERSAKAR